MKKQKYVKPQLIAKNNPTGSFAAGCPTNNTKGGNDGFGCKAACEIRR